MSPSLDAHGDISVVIIVVYIFVAIGAAMLTFKYGFRREAGWVMILVFSLIRIAGGISDVIAEKSSPPSSGAYTATFILQSTGAAPLLIATSAFLGILVSVTTTPDPIPFTETRFFRIIRLAITIGLILGVVGGVDASSTSSDSKSTGKVLRKAGALVLFGAYVVTTLQYLVVASNRSRILQHRWALLTCCLLALPFLGIRIVYSILSAFAPFPQFNENGVIPQSGGLADFSSIGGKWQIYLVMSVLMEFIVVSIYILGEFMTNKNAKNVGEPVANDDYNNGSYGGNYNGNGYAVPLHTRK